MSNDKDNPTEREIDDALRGLDPALGTLRRSFDIEFEWIRCTTCDMFFYVPAYWVEQRRKHHNTFYCPNGHAMEYGKTE